MMNRLTILMTTVLMTLPSLLMAQVQDITIRQLNTYENLTAFSQINQHPLGVGGANAPVVRFTAVVVSYPRNSGLASYTVASNSIGRIHTFVVDTNAASMGLDGMYMQIVDAVRFELIEQLNRGDILTIEGRISYFAQGTSWGSQFNTTSVTLVGNVFEDSQFNKYQPLLQPTVVSVEDINRKLPDGTFEGRIENYTKYVNRYVKVEDTRVINRLVANTGRPWMYVGNENAILPTTDTSLRFRNDRATYRTGYNNRKTEDGPFVPPVPGTVVDLSGFIVVNSFNVDNTGANSFKIVPWDDGVVWVPGETEGTFVRLTPEGWPNDLVVVGFPPEFSSFIINDQTPTSTEQVTVSLNIASPNEGVTVTSASITYTAKGASPVTANLVKGSGNSYSFTFPTFPNLTSVSFVIDATLSNGISGRFSAANTNFIVLDNAINTIATIQQTANGQRGASPLTGLGVLPMNITATVVADSSDGFIVVQTGSDMFSGIPLINNATTRKLRKGDVVTITAAEVLRQFDMNYLSNLTYTVQANGNPNFNDLAPLLTTGAFATGNRGWEYLGMLVRFENVAIASRNPDAPAGDNGEWSFANSGQTPLRVDDRFAFTALEVRTNFGTQFNRNLVLGAEITSLRGIAQWSFSNPKLAIRTLADLQTTDNLTVPSRTFPLLGPADNAAVDVVGTITPTWDNTSVDPDGDAPKYLFVLATKPATGPPNFSAPLAVVPSNTNGTAGEVSLPAAVINPILDAQGMVQNETRAFAWTVWVTDTKDTVQVSTYANATGYTPIFRTVNLKKLTPTSIEDNNLPKEFSLSQNYPNPFNPSTVINFSLPQDAQVKLTVYDMLGREVAVMVNELRSAGTYSISVDGRSMASGIYVYRLEAGNRTFTRKMTLIK
jgi:hypothetical protein